MNINDLFSTPEQGRRLKELVPELTSAFVWERLNLKYHIQFSDDRFSKKHPALTLQELRDVAREQILLEYDETVHWVYSCLIRLNTAPELAAWVIERLEEAQ